MMMFSTLSKTITLLLTGMLALTLLSAADLSVKSYVDKSVVTAGERFILSVEIAGADSEKAPSPELPPMEFARYLGNGSSRSVQIVNGHMTSTKTLNYYYQATRNGSFEIGPVRLVHAGTEYRTDPIRIQVQQQARPQAGQGTGQVEGMSSQDLFVRASLSKSRVYQNEPVVVTYRIYTRISVSGYNLLKSPDKSGFWAEDLLKDQNVETTTEILNGRRYTTAIVEKKALFPTTSGTKTLDPMEIECDVRTQKRRRSVFDDFFSDPFGRTQRVIIRSRPLEIEVLPLPDSGKPDDFSGVVGRFSIEGEVDKNRVPVNEVVTLKFKMSGSGNIKTLPAPKLSFSPGLETYEPKVTERTRPTENGLTGYRTYEYVLVPRTPGPKTVGGFRLPYFDPVDETYQVATLDDILLDVEEGTIPIADSGTSSLAKEDVRLVSQEIRFIKLNSEGFRDVRYVFYKNAWFWTSLLLPILAVLGATLRRKHLDRLQGDVAYARRRRAARQAQKRLAAARAILSQEDHGGFYAEVARALTGFAADQLNLSEAGLMKEDLNKLWLDRGVSEKSVQAYLDCLSVCDMQRFSPVGTNTDQMSEFLSRAEQAIVGMQMEFKRR
jgi:hypothetical protein